MDKEQSLAELFELYRTRRIGYINKDQFDNAQGDDPILNDGNHDAKIMVIARDLGATEVEMGVPLIGKAGQLFRRMLEYVGLSINDIYIANLMPYKPVDNVAFSQDVRSDFMDLLEKHIQIIDPRVIVTLGAEATSSVLQREIPSITKFVASVLDHRNFWFNHLLGKPDGGWACSCAHPSYLLRNGAGEGRLDGFLVKKYGIAPLLIADELASDSNNSE